MKKLWWLVRLGLIIPLILIWTSFWPVSSVSAHAVLVNSTPDYGAAVDQSPPEIKLVFSEAIDPSFSTARLVDSNNRVIVPGPGEMVPGNPFVMRLPLPHLPDGIYSVIYKNRSAEDGHVVEGVISFSVGKSTPRVSQLPPIGADYPAFTLPPIFDILIRWLSYLGMAGILGALIFRLVVWRPNFTQDGAPSDQKGNTHVLTWVRQQINVSVLLVILMAIGLLISQTLQASTGAFLPALAQLSGGSTGRLLGVRVLLVLLIWLWFTRTHFPQQIYHRWKSDWSWIIALSLGLATALTFSLQGHAAAGGSPLSIAADWLHLSAVSAWIGGLVLLTRMLRQDSISPDMAFRFTRMALISVDAIAASGFYSLWVNSGSVGALTGTTYGRDLLVKIGLFFILVIIGYINMRLIAPGFAGGSGPGNRGSRIRWLAMNMRIELAIALIVLLAAGLLAGAATGDEALLEQQHLGYVETAKESGVGLTLLVIPPVVGTQEIGVDLVDPRPTAAKDTVLIRFTYQDSYIGTNQATLNPQSSSPSPTGSPTQIQLETRRYATRGAYLSIAGRWQITVIVRQPNEDDVYHMFFVQVTK